MDFLCAGLPQQPDDPLAGGTPDNGIVNQHNALAADGLRDHVQFDPYGGFPQ